MHGLANWYCNKEVPVAPMVHVADHARHLLEPQQGWSASRLFSTEYHAMHSTSGLARAGMDVAPEKPNV